METTHTSPQPDQEKSMGQSFLGQERQARRPLAQDPEPVQAEGGQGTLRGVAGEHAGQARSAAQGAAVRRLPRCGADSAGGHALGQWDRATKQLRTDRLPERTLCVCVWVCGYVCECVCVCAKLCVCVRALVLTLPRVSVRCTFDGSLGHVRRNWTCLCFHLVVDLRSASSRGPGGSTHGEIACASLSLAAPICVLCEPALPAGSGAPW